MTVKKRIEHEKLYLRKLKNRNKKILNQPSRVIEKQKVNLHWWSTRLPNQVENIGDYLSTVVCDFMLQKKGLDFNVNVKETKHLYSIGSIIQGGAHNAVIWGSGLKHGAEDIGIIEKATRKLDVRLVRGPETRNALVEKGYSCPEKYGDPALLMPLIYKPVLSEKKDYLVILHHETRLNIAGSITPMSNDYKEFIDTIYNSKLVISSSLHGIILAEAYGIPAVLLNDKCTESIFKYDDYYHSTGRYNYPIVNSVEEGLKVIPAEIPDFTEIQKNIMDTFPYDLWD